MTYQYNGAGDGYFPPVLGNGEIALFIDKEGTLNYERTDYDVKNMNAIAEPVIFRAGRRTAAMHTSKRLEKTARLLSFGKFRFDCGEETKEWTQELIPEKGKQRTVCKYPSGEKIISTAFVHPKYDVYALKKEFSGSARKASFSYTLCGYEKSTDDAIQSIRFTAVENGVRISFVMWGLDRYTGEIYVFLNRRVETETSGNTATLHFSVDAADTVEFYIAIADDLYGDDAAAVNDQAKEHIDAVGFEGLEAETEQFYTDYFSKGYVRTGNDKIDSVYNSALYDFVCNTTRWSIPVGLHNNAWDGKFFAFDEYYGYLGLLTANRTELAKRVPEFRKNVCLDKAIFRTTMSRSEADAQARFCWETNEYGDEVAASGFWYDHIFHMATVAIGTYQYYEFTQDVSYLKECYRMIRACAKFYTVHMLYTDSDGRVYVGKCTDLERLGPSVENPFMTACGVIKTLECLVKSADVLNIDREYRDECAYLSGKLYESLPKENGEYTPFLGCPQKSVAVFAGKFPFDVIKKDDPCLLPAWNSFMEEETKFGNMYNMGKGVSPWYACWKAEGFARMGMAKEAYDALSQVLPTAGKFGELFEINEPGLSLRPWFTTAAGIYLSTVNEMLLQSDENNIYLLPAYPESEKPVSFRLPAKGGAIVEATVLGDSVYALQVTMRDGIPPHGYTVHLRGKALYDIRPQNDCLGTDL